MTIRNWRREAETLLSRRETMERLAGEMHAKIAASQDVSWTDIEGLFGVLQDLNARVTAIDPSDYARFNAAAAGHLGAAYDLAVDFGAVGPKGVAVNNAIRSLADGNRVFRARTLTGTSISIGSYTAAELATLDAALVDLIAAL